MFVGEIANQKISFKVSESLPKNGFIYMTFP